MGYESLLTHFYNNENSYIWRMFMIGFSTHVHWEVMLGLTHYLFTWHSEIESFMTLKVINYGFVVLATFANARHMLTIEHMGRFQVSKYLFVNSYIFFVVAFIFSGYRFCMNIASVGLIILTFATIYGQLTVLGYQKNIPQELIIWYMLGRQAADLIGMLASVSPHT